MAKKSEFLHALGVLMAIWTTLVELVRELGGGDDDFSRLAKPEGRSILAEIAKLIVAAGKKSVATIWPSVMVTIDYATASMASLIKACNFPDGYGNREIVEIFKLTGKGKVEAKVEFVHLYRGLSSTEMLEELDKLGFESALPEQLVAAAAADQTLGLEFPVVAFDSRARHRGDDRLVVVLGRSSLGRVLHPLYYGDWTCFMYGRVAAVRKSSLGPQNITA